MAIEALRNGSITIISCGLLHVHYYLNFKILTENCNIDKVV